jgi:hypothetical protein
MAYKSRVSWILRRIYCNSLASCILRHDTNSTLIQPLPLLTVSVLHIHIHTLFLPLFCWLCALVCYLRFCGVVPLVALAEAAAVVKQIEHQPFGFCGENALLP